MKTARKENDGFEPVSRELSVDIKESSLISDIKDKILNTKDGELYLSKYIAEKLYFDHNNRDDQDDLNAYVSCIKNCIKSYPEAWVPKDYSIRLVSSGMPLLKPNKVYLSRLHKSGLVVVEEIEGEELKAFLSSEFQEKLIELSQNI